MVRFRDILGGVAREKTGMQQKIESIRNRVSVYESIVSTIDNIEGEAISSLDNDGNADWSLNKAQNEAVRYRYINGTIDDSDFLSALQMIEQERENIIAQYVDSDTNVSIVSYKNMLYRIKSENGHLVGIDGMDFDTWGNIKLSREVASSIRVCIENGEDYANAEKVAQEIWRYRRDRHMRK